MPQVLQVSSRDQRQALQSGDVWAAVGPSSTLVPLALSHNNIALVAPVSGTALWSNLWTVPKQPVMKLPKSQGGQKVNLFSFLAFAPKDAMIG